MRKFISLAVFILLYAFGNAQEWVINTSFEPEENFPGGNLNERYDFTGKVTDLLGNKWTPSSNLQSWRFAYDSKYDRSPVSGNHSVWVKNNSFLECAPSGSKGGGILEFWAIVVSSHGNPFTINVEYRVDDSEWESAFSKEYFAKPADWEKISVPIYKTGNVKVRISSTGAQVDDKGWLIDDLSLTAFDNTVPMSYMSSTFEHDKSQLKVGENQVIGIVKVNMQGVINPLLLDKLTVNLNGTKNIDDITGINIYYTGDKEEFSTATRYGAESIQPSGNDIEIEGTQELGYGKNCFYVVLNLKETAKEGSWFDAECVSLTINGKDITPEVTAPEGRKDYLLRTVLVKQGDKGVHTYRIPALVTAPDGTVVAAYDYRWNGSGDLPGDIDVGVSLSHDNGITWEESFVAMDLEYGVGDPILTVDRETGRIFLMALYGDGGTGLFSKPVSGKRPVITVSHSDDNGSTWSDPRTISAEVNAAGWATSLASPGTGIQMRNGTIVIPAYARPVDEGNALNSFIFYSKDHGENWRASSLLPVGTTECTVVELNDGRLMLNMRNHHGKGVRAVAYTDDLGTTWSDIEYPSELTDPVCQGNIIRYTSTLDGYQKDRILFSNASADSRVRMTVKMSYDEGATWPVSKLIEEGPSGYSAMTVLADGNIGLLWETGKTSIVESIQFMRIPLDWLTNGQDKIEKTATGVIEVKGIENVQVYPNPASLFIYVDLSLNTPGDVMVNIFNLKGQLVKNIAYGQLSEGSNQLKIDCSTLNSGEYILTIKASDRTSAHNVIISK